VSDSVYNITYVERTATHTLRGTLALPHIHCHALLHTTNRTAAYCCTQCDHCTHTTALTAKDCHTQACARHCRAHCRTLLHTAAPPDSHTLPCALPYAICRMHRLPYTVYKAICCMPYVINRMPYAASRMPCAVCRMLDDVCSACRIFHNNNKHAYAGIPVIVLHI
jgi:hypothetical protein